jgi:crotonobetainyl-CoA:carnitine CoA-transferase CaiB-like acyl-CoA transferase
MTILQEPIMSEQSGGTTPSGPLAGLRILDLTRILAGPTCTQLLGDLGADVIKIEKPGAGDDTRKWGPPYVNDAEGHPTNESAYYLCTNRNKRSVTIDMSKPEGAELLLRLLEQCDVLIENFKAGGLAKYGLDYGSLRERFPGLVYCSITGFGQTGPNAHRPGYDVLAQGMGGIMSLTGEPDGQPMKVGVGITDVMCGMYAATSILAALRHRDSTGIGQHIDLALVDSQVAWLINEGTNYLMSGDLPVRRGTAHPNIVPYQVFASADGHVIVAVGNDAQYQRFCQAVGVPHLAADPRFTTNTDRIRERQTLVPLIAEALAELPSGQILAALEQAGVPSSPVNDLAQVFDDPQTHARDMHIKMQHPLAGSGTVDLIGNPIKMSATPVTYRRPPPPLGLDTDDVLDELLGLSPDERGALKAQDII